jgi:potassium channel subfamily K
VNGLESEGRPIKDPHWLIALNVVSLVSALIANLVLLFNFAQRIRYSLAQPITIILWYFSGFILIALLGVTPHLESQNAQTPHHRFSQSYYSGIISAALYLILSTLLHINFLTSSPMPYFPRRRTHKHHDEGDDQDTQRRKGASKSAMRVRKIYTHPPSFAPLTIPQRTLMLQSTFLTIYLGIGALIFSALQRHTFSPLTPTSQQSSSGGAGPNFNETLTFPSALYFVDYTILTIGLGCDFPLQTPAGRGVMVPYAMGGILMVGMVVGSVRGLVVERAKVKGWRRGVWKERRRVLRENQSIDGSDDGNEKLGKREKARSTSLRNGFDAEAFKAMRAIERKVSKKQDRLNTINATLAFLIVWFMGALVFYFTEVRSFSLPSQPVFIYPPL